MGSVSVTSANELSLEELTQIFRIKFLISRFPEIFASVRHKMRPLRVA